MNFKVGQKVQIKNVLHGGNFENGDIVTIKQIGNDDDPDCYGAISPHDGLMWYLYKDEIALVATKADRIRALTDEELAEKFVDATYFRSYSSARPSYAGPNGDELLDRTTAVKAWLNYLKQPAKDNI